MRGIASWPCSERARSGEIAAEISSNVCEHQPATGEPVRGRASSHLTEDAWHRGGVSFLLTARSPSNGLGVSPVRNKGKSHA